MKTNEENSLEVLKEVLPLLEAQEDYSNDALFALLKKYVDEKGVKVGYVMWPIRTAVSGNRARRVVQQRLWKFLEKKNL